MLHWGKDVNPGLLAQDCTDASLPSVNERISTEKMNFMLWPNTLKHQICVQHLRWLLCVPAELLEHIKTTLGLI